VIEFVHPIQVLIESTLAMKLLDGEVVPGASLTVDADTKKNAMTFEPAAAKTAHK
jgi:hypothetical protein